MFSLLGTINEESTVEVFEDGGYLIAIPGYFEDGHKYNVHIGDYRNSNDAICYSAIPEQGATLYPQLNGTLYTYTPLLLTTDSSPFSLTVIDEDTLETSTLIDSVFVRKKQYHNKVYRIRKLLPPTYKTGARMIEEE